MKKNSKKRIRHQKNGFYLKIAWFVFLCLISVLSARYILVGINDMLAIGKEATTVMVEIPQGASLSRIAQILEERGMISEKEFFKIYTIVTRVSKKFSPGVYELETGMDYQMIVNRLKNKSNIKNVAEITFTEGMNINDYAQLLEKNKVCSKDEFLKYCNSDKFDKDYNFINSIDNINERVYKLEGYLFPDTYKFYQGEKPTTIISKLLGNFQKKIIDKNQLRGYDGRVSIAELAKQQNLSIDKLINIASLIQSEAANVNDMYKVSSVIHNRLKTLSSGGKNKFGEFSMGILRVDATVYYPYKTKANLPKNTTARSSYDTYKIQGLPPSPICNPGVDAILAAINPADTSYYYYCHSKSGEAFYATTNSEHIANLKKAGLS